MIRMYDVENLSERRDGTTSLPSSQELKVHLLRNRTLTFGKAPFEDGLSRRNTDLDSPIAMQLDDNEDDPLAGICAGQDFGLLTTTSGKVLITFLPLTVCIFAVKQLLSTSFALVLVSRNLFFCLLPLLKSFIEFTNVIIFSGLLHWKRYKSGL